MDFTWNDLLKLVAVIPSMIFAARITPCLHCRDNLRRFIIKEELGFNARSL